ncbi:MAG: PH domain-containing protein [Hyphomonadaceae bacterium]|nr:PH domain-containing protein [Hyphomonadaceae bacterium]
MSYLAKRLAPGETIVATGRFHWMQYVYAWALLILLGVVLIGVFIWMREMIRLATTEFLVTNRRIVLKEGFLAVRVDEVTLNSIEGAHIEQSLIGRLFNYGRLTIRGSGDTHLLFPTMADPGKFRSAAEGARITRETAAQTTTR